MLYFVNTPPFDCHVSFEWPYTHLVQSKIKRKFFFFQNRIFILNKKKKKSGVFV